MSAYVAEFFGTMMLVLLGDGVVASVLLKKTKSEGAGWLTVVLGWGLAVTMGIYAVGRISGAHLNPAVTIGLMVDGSFPTDMVAGYIAAQFAGAFVGAVLVWLFFLPHWRETPDGWTKLGVFCTRPSIPHTLSNLFCEVIATAVLVLGILLIGANKFAEGLNPIVVGALVSSIGLSLGGTTGFAINPARDLGPRIAHAILPIHGKGESDWGYSWIPVVGPILGGIVGALVYNWVFA
jgi:glycerol uptake facilitator protein